MEIGPIRNQNLIFWPLTNVWCKLRRASAPALPASGHSAVHVPQKHALSPVPWLHNTWAFKCEMAAQKAEAKELLDQAQDLCELTPPQRLPGVLHKVVLFLSGGVAVFALILSSQACTMLRLHCQCCMTWLASGCFHTSKQLIKY